MGDNWKEAPYKKGPRAEAVTMSSAGDVGLTAERVGLQRGGKSFPPSWKSEYSTDATYIMRHTLCLHHPKRLAVFKYLVLLEVVIPANCEIVLYF